MKCPQCNTDNAPNSIYCKSCGASLNSKMKTCNNGHNFDASLDACPFCPSYGSASNLAETVIESSIGDKDQTVLESSSGDRDKTVISRSAPKLKPASTGLEDGKTIIYSPQSSTGTEGQKEPQAGIRKLVGWLVSYDINPAGTDFKLYVGRQLIGRKSTNDIVLQQPGVSEDHAIILYRNEKFVIQDNMSTNGTFVNGESIEEKTELFNDDIIKVGNIELKFKKI